MIIVIVDVGKCFIKTIIFEIESLLNIELITQTELALKNNTLEYSHRLMKKESALLHSFQPPQQQHLYSELLP